MFHAALDMPQPSTLRALELPGALSRPSVREWPRQQQIPRLLLRTSNISRVGCRHRTGDLGRLCPAQALTLVPASLGEGVGKVGGFGFRVLAGLQRGNHVVSGATPRASYTRTSLYHGITYSALSWQTLEPSSCSSFVKLR